MAGTIARLQAAADVLQYLDQRPDDVMDDVMVMDDSTTATTTTITRDGSQTGVTFELSAFEGDDNSGGGSGSGGVDGREVTSLSFVVPVKSRNDAPLLR